MVINLDHNGNLIDLTTKTITQEEYPVIYRVIRDLERSGKDGVKTVRAPGASS